MRLAYHPNGVNLTSYALNAWLQQAKIDILSVPNAVLADVGAPAHPYKFGGVVLSDDRETQTGLQYSRIKSVRRMASIEFPVCSIERKDVWDAWYVATLGGRVQFMFEEPNTLEWLIVKAKSADTPSLTDYQLYKPATLELIEWL